MKIRDTTAKSERIALTLFTPLSHLFTRRKTVIKRISGERIINSSKKENGKTRVRTDSKNLTATDTVPLIKSARATDLIVRKYTIDDTAKSINESDAKRGIYFFIISLSSEWLLPFFVSK